MIFIRTPIGEHEVEKLQVGDHIEISGVIYCGRDAVLPKLVRLIETGDVNRVGINVEGGVIFHTAVSPAGIGPTSSNKVEIEECIPALSKAGVRIHIGKGALGSETVEELRKYHSVFAVSPPVSALFSEKILSRRVAAFREEGMEALYQLEVRGFPAIIAIAHGKTIFGPRQRGG